MSDSIRQPDPTENPSLDESLEVGPDVDPESWRLQVPAKPACYLLADEIGRPVLLSTVGALRGALVRRLTDRQEDEATRRLDYRQVVRRVRFRRVFSRFEAHWAYLENVRDFFPDDYAQRIRRWTAHWAVLDLEGDVPRWNTSRRPSAAPARCLGPLPDARAARRLVQQTEDLFDLCREHDILARAPDGVACSYKQMGRCPAPCDGSVPMQAYRDRLNASYDFVVGRRQERLDEWNRQMRAAAEQRRFEQAAAFKRRLETAAALEAPAYGHLRPIGAFRYLSIQPGSGKGRVRVFQITPGSIRLWGEVGADLHASAAESLHAWASSANPWPPEVARSGSERMGLAAWHLFHDRRSGGRWLHAPSIDDAGEVQQALQAVAGVAKAGAIDDLSSDVESG